MKKRILFIYPSMVIGGSTAALLSLMNNLNPEEYEIDLQMFRNEGPLLDMIPDYVNLQPAAERYAGPQNRWARRSKFILGGYAGRFLWRKYTGGFSDAVRWEFQVKALSRKNEKEYDYAIGFMEGWSDWYLAYGVKAKTKYGWLHSTYAKITSDPTSELPWMKQTDKIVFVTEACRRAFCETLPSMAHKTVTISNITDSRIIRTRSGQADEADTAYQDFVKSDAFKIVTVCRLTIWVKGLDRIVTAAAQLKDWGFRFLWYIIGDGEEDDRMMDMIRDGNVEDCVVPIGKRMNPYPFVAAADISCMPSRHEGKPLAVTESMILGVPPVVTEYISAHEQVEDGVEGIIVENRDDTIAEAVRKCMADAEMLNRMRRSLRSREYGNREDIRKIEEILFSDKTGQ